MMQQDVLEQMVLQHECVCVCVCVFLCDFDVRFRCVIFHLYSFYDQNHYYL